MSGDYFGFEIQNSNRRNKKLIIANTIIVKNVFRRTLKEEQRARRYYGNDKFYDL